MTTTNLNDQVKRKMALCPEDGAKLTIAWNYVWACIEDVAAQRRPKMKSFEVAHMTETARKAIFEAFVNGEADLATLALASIGIKK